MNNDKNKKYNLRITRALPFKNKPGFWSYNIDAKAFDAIQKVEIGGRLVLSERERENKETGEKYTEYVFEYMDPSQVALVDKFREGKKEAKKETSDLLD